MQVLDDVYHAQYQKDSLQPEGIVAFDVIADELVKMFAPKTAMDVGCGGGALIQGLIKRGVDAFGIEGSSHAKQYMPDRIWIHDLRHELSHLSDQGYDLVSCSDVAEHIEPEFAGIFCDNIVKQMHGRSVLVFGPAGEGQDGHYHVNLRHPCYWIGMMEERGLKLLPNKSEELRQAIKARPEHAFIWWYSKNLLIFEVKDRGL